MKNTTITFTHLHHAWITVFVIFLLPACYQTEEILPVNQVVYEDQIIPLGTYEAIIESEDTPPFQMIIRSNEVTDQKFIISNFADLRVDVSMQAFGEVAMLDQQSLGRHQGVEHIITTGSMHQLEEHRFSIEYQVKEGNVEVNHVLPVLFLGPCE